MENPSSHVMTQLTDSIAFATTSGAQLSDKIQFAQFYFLLTKATADEEEPTPGYMLSEIRDITFHCQLVDYLNRRLCKPSTTVKIKVLKIIIYLVHNGHINVRKHLRANDGPIKAALKYHGPPDAMVGNTPYETVRNLAEEALECLFNPELVARDDMAPSSETSSPSNAGTNFMGGLGSAFRNNSNSKYEGFGNSPRDKECTVADKMRDYLGRLIQPSENQTNEVIRAALQSSPGDYQPVSVSGTFVEPQVPPQPLTKSTYVKSHVPGRAGGGWESDEEDVPAETDIKVSLSSFGSVQTDPQRETISKATERSYLTPEESSREGRQLVLDFCSRTSLASVIELDEICKRCSTLDRMDVVGTITEILSEGVCEGGGGGGGGGGGVGGEGRRTRALLLAEWLLQQDPIAQHSLSRLLPSSLAAILKDKTKCSPPLSAKARKLQLMLDKWATHCDNIPVSS